MKWYPRECSKGDIVRIRVGAIYHYGIYCSDDEVIQFGSAPIGGFPKDLSAIKVMSTDAYGFSCGMIVEVGQPEGKEKKRRFPPEKTVGIARSRIGEGGYDILRNNCEHFATECYFGERRCEAEESARERWRKRPIFDLYVFPLPDDASVPDLPKDLKKLINRSGDPKEKNAIEYALFIARAAVGLSWGYDEDEIKPRRIKGKENRFMLNKTQFVTIASSCGMVFAALSDREASLYAEPPTDSTDTVLISSDDPPFRVFARGERAGGAIVWLMRSDLSRKMLTDAKITPGGV